MTIRKYVGSCTPDVRQCLIYDSPKENARLIGIEYMISPRLYNDLPTSERKLWHSHKFEVKSGMLIMPVCLCEALRCQLADVVIRLLPPSRERFGSMPRLRRWR